MRGTRYITRNFNSQYKVTRNVSSNMRGTRYITRNFNLQYKVTRNVSSNMRGTRYITRNFYLITELHIMYREIVTCAVLDVFRATLTYNNPYYAIHYQPLSITQPMIAQQ